MAALELSPGMEIAARYRLVRLLGEGGMGAVWAATHLVTRKHVALKFIKEADSGSQTVRRFLREARAISAVNHPNVVEVHDILHLDDGLPVMVMDLLNGVSLGERLARTQTIPLQELAEILVPVLSAVGTAHAVGIVHRDLKPDNIYLHVRPDGMPEPKVLDFGIAKLNATEGEAAATAHLTQTGAMLGTPYYMSPEQIFGEKDIDQRVDVWAMGVILYQCLSGRRPVSGDNLGQLFKAIATGDIVPLEQVAPHVPLDVTRLVGRMLARDRNQRATDLREAYEVLGRYSSLHAKSFGEPAAPVAYAATGSEGTGPGGLALQATELVGAPGLAGSSSAVFSRTTPEGERALPMRRTWPFALAGGIVVAGIAAGVWYSSRAIDAPTAAASATGSSERPVAPASVAATPATEPVPSRDLASHGSRQDAGVSPAPRATMSPAQRKPTAPAPVPRRDPAVTASPAPAPTPDPAPAPAPPREEAPKSEKKLPGSVVQDVPF